MYCLRPLNCLSGIYKIIPIYKYISEDNDKLTNLYYRIYNPLISAGEKPEDIRTKLMVIYVFVCLLILLSATSGLEMF